MAAVRPFYRFKLWLGALFAIAGAVLTWFWVQGDPRSAHPIASHLADRGRVAVVGTGRIPETAEGTDLVPVAPESRLARALAGSDEAEFAAALVADRFEGLLVLGEHQREVSDDPSVENRLRAYHRIDSLRGVYLLPEASLYRRAVSPGLSDSHRTALAVVARRILAGEAPPQLESFPIELRAQRELEVIVLIKEGHVPRLWRSARSYSLARGLLTAATVARQRWSEREGAMGDAIDDVLPELEVEVAVLEDDGTLGSLADGWLRQAVSLSHGLGYEQRGSWQYLLPHDTRRQGGGLAAFEYLLAEGERGADYLSRPDVRCYRLVMTSLSTSAAPSPDPSPTPSPSSSPDE